MLWEWWLQSLLLGLNKMGPAVLRVHHLSKGAPIVKAMIHPGASAKGNPNFDPKIINVSKGGGIIWTNNDNVPHT